MDLKNKVNVVELVPNYTCIIRVKNE